MRRARIKRNVCVTQQCSRKCFKHTYCPEDCEFEILHALDDEQLIECKRRSGKTTKLVECANKLIDAGHIVYFITPLVNQFKTIQSGCKLNKNVKCLSLDQVQHGKMRGLKCGAVLTDEIQPCQFVHLREYFELGFYFWLGYYTKWEPR